MLLCNTTFVSQVLIQIVDASSVITWDFDVCKGDIVFNIFHSKRAPQPPKKDSLGAHSITSPGGNNVQLIDKVWQLGRDYSMVESPLICKEGESVQVRPPNPRVEQLEACSDSQLLEMAEGWFSSALPTCSWPMFQLCCQLRAGVAETEQQEMWGSHLRRMAHLGKSRACFVL